MFEQLVRPFQSRSIGTTRRIVPVQTDPPATPDEARITWGSVGALAQGVVQPKGTDLENIETVGWNVRGSIDKFNQSSRRDERVELPINDESGNRVGTATIDRAKEVEFKKPYLPNFGYNQNYRPGRKPFSYEAEGKPKKYDMSDYQFAESPTPAPVSPPPVPPPKPDPPPAPTVVPPAPATTDLISGLRQNVPGNDVMGRTDFYTYPA